MTDDRRSEKRRAAGLQPFAGHLGALGRHIAGADWPLYASLLRHWTEIVGAERAAFLSCLRVEKRRDGACLHLAVPGAMAPLVQMELPQILEKLDRFLGQGSIQRIQLVHLAPKRHAPARQAVDNPEPTLPVISADIRARIEDPALQAALSALEAAIPKPQGKK